MKCNWQEAEENVFARDPFADGEGLGLSHVQRDFYWSRFPQSFGTADFESKRVAWVYAFLILKVWNKNLERTVFLQSGTRATNATLDRTVGADGFAAEAQADISSLLLKRT